MGDVALINGREPLEGQFLGLRFAMQHHGAFRHGDPRPGQTAEDLIGMNLQAIVVHEQLGHTEILTPAKHRQIVGNPDIRDGLHGLTLVDHFLDHADFVKTQRCGRLTVIGKKHLDGAAGAGLAEGRRNARQLVGIRRAFDDHHLGPFHGIGCRTDGGIPVGHQGAATGNILAHAVVLLASGTALV